MFNFKKSKIYNTKGWLQGAREFDDSSLDSDEGPVQIKEAGSLGQDILLWKERIVKDILKIGLGEVSPRQLWRGSVWTQQDAKKMKLLCLTSPDFLGFRARPLFLLLVLIDNR